WARQWYALSDPGLKPGADAYNGALQAITDQFTRSGGGEFPGDPEAPPNRSPLSQLRTNEIALSLKNGDKPPVWEVREFRLDVHGKGYLREVSVGQTPDLDKLNGKERLANFINQHEGAVLAKRHNVPVEFEPGDPFLGGSALTPPNTFWNAPGINKP